MGFEMPEQSFYKGRCIPVPLVGDELQQFKHKLIKAMHSSPDGSISLGVVSDKELEQYKQDLIRSISKGADNMEDVPMNIRQLEEKGKDCERLAEPEYYAGNGLSPLEAFKKGLLSREETIGFIKGNVIKYTVRAGHKESASRDIVKAIDYLGHLKRLYEDELRVKYEE